MSDCNVPKWRTWDKQEPLITYLLPAKAGHKPTKGQEAREYALKGQNCYVCFFFFLMVALGRGTQLKKKNSKDNEKFPIQVPVT